MKLAPHEKRILIMYTAENEGRLAASRILFDGVNRILSDWEKNVRKIIPGASKQDRIALRDSLPKFIQKLAETLSCKDPLCEAEVMAEVAKEHGEDRAQESDFSLEQMINEYQILRTTILNYLEEKAPIDHQTNLILNDFIDRGMKKASAEFSRLVAEKQLSQIVSVGLLHKASEKNELDLARIIKVLEQERELRDRFIATLTHDLRTPLTSAKIGAQLIVRKSESQELVLTTANRIINSMNRADKMIRDLLDANTLKAGERFPVKISECNLSDLVTDTLSDLSNIYGNRFFVEEIGADVKGFWDRVGLQRMIENLCSNAIKYGSNDTKISIRVEVTETTIVIGVTNFGNPIPPDEIDRIFDPYKRAVSAVAGAHVGWGVGLTLVKGIAEAHGGKVSLKSTTEDGTTFYISLPRDCRSTHD